MTGCLLAAILAATIPLAPVPAFSVEAGDSEPPSFDGSDEMMQRQRSREAELETVRRSLEVSEKRQSALREEIDAIEGDRARLNADLIATAKRLRDTEAEIARIETRLDELHASDEAIRQSLHDRRDVIADILVALQRMGRTPPPAILSRPEDALAAIRGSILAGSVLPDLRSEAEQLATDLSELTRLTQGIEEQRDALETRYASLGEERTRIDLLVASKQTQRDQTAEALQAERDKAADLAAKAQNVEGLIASLENEIAAAAEAAREAERARVEAAKKKEEATPAEVSRRLADTSRIAPAVPFAKAKGRLTTPVAGPKILDYGEADGLGGEAEGISIAATPGTTVVSPADGWVVYAGPFRSYGQVLILNAGDGYHVVLAGMEKVEASLGQFVLAGEPVAAMGATRLASIGDIDHTSAQPTLYVEFRKDGEAIDSAPWWAPDNRNEVNG